MYEPRHERRDVKIGRNVILTLEVFYEHIYHVLTEERLVLVENHQSHSVSSTKSNPPHN